MGARARALGGAVALAGGLMVGVRAAAAERPPVVPPSLGLVVGWSEGEHRASSAAAGIDAARVGGLTVALVATWRPPQRGASPVAPPDDAAVEPLPVLRVPGLGAAEAAERGAQLAALRAERAALDAVPPSADPHVAVAQALRRAELDAWLVVLDPLPWRALARAEAAEAP